MPGQHAGARPNIERPEFDQLRDRDGFRALRAGIGQQLGTERIGLSLWEIPPGEAAYPYHFHLAEEEVIVVIEGTPDLRTPDGTRKLDQGEVVNFPRGEPDIVLYPDSGKLGAAERRPGGGGLHKFFRVDDAVGYWDGEEPPGGN
jgi:uncharacterized cupin superfamily protein